MNVEQKTYYENMMEANLTEAAACPLPSDAAWTNIGRMRQYTRETPNIPLSPTGGPFEFWVSGSPATRLTVTYRSV